jgi:Mrp family chromosome partitioning ATPase
MNAIGPDGSGHVLAAADVDLVQFMQPKDASQLIHRIQRVARNSGKLIEFIGPHGGEGTSSIARDFALLMMQRSHRPVLLLDLDVPANGHFRWLSEHATLAPAPTKIALARGELRLHRLGATSLVVSEMAIDPQGLEPQTDLLAESHILDQMRDVFSLIVIDAPPLARSFEGVAFSAVADATVMVIEAERTRAPVANALGDRLTEAGAKLVGFVFNKRRYYVPEFLYRKL